MFDRNEWQDNNAESTSKGRWRETRLARKLARESDREIIGIGRAVICALFIWVLIITSYLYIRGQSGSNERARNLNEKIDKCLAANNCGDKLTLQDFSNKCMKGDTINEIVKPFGHLTINQAKKMYLDESVENISDLRGAIKVLKRRENKKEDAKKNLPKGKNVSDKQIKEFNRYQVCKEFNDSRDGSKRKKIRNNHKEE